MPDVEIRVVEGKVRVSEDPVRCHRRKETVRWRCEQYKFEVLFKNDSPFVSGPRHPGAKGERKDSGPCRSETELKRYEYGVKVWVNEQGPPLFEDPGVDVWDDGTDER